VKDFLDRPSSAQLSGDFIADDLLTGRWCYDGWPLPSDSPAEKIDL